MRRVIADIHGSHPSFGICVVKAVPIKLDVRGHNESVNIVGRDSYLDLCCRLCCLVDQDSHLLAVCNALTALGGPDEEPLICVDVRRYFGKR